jgi:NADPH:quinone reductase-like Zn-dependent oxidoreductase
MNATPALEVVVTATEQPLMQAVVNNAYGALSGLTVKQVKRPVVGDHQVLVRVSAAALHIGDCFSVRGTPLPMRLATGLFRPKVGIPGFDLSGRVEAVGRAVTRLRVGDEVFGAGFGTCAQYACVEEQTLVPKPINLSLEASAALATSGLAALHGLRDSAKLQAGMKVLIIGASGGVGSFAVQIAKAMGAEVTGVCSSANLGLVQSLGADQVIDYQTEDFARGLARYDVVFDNVESRSLADCRSVLVKGGTVVLNSGTGTSGFATLVRLLRPLALSPFVGHRLKRFISEVTVNDLMELKRLVESGKVKPVIGSTFALDQTVHALQHIETGHARGKVLVHVENSARV